MAESQSINTSKINITIKTPKDNKSIEINSDADIRELRNLTANAFDVRIEQVCLIFAGKILKDVDTLAHHNISDNLTVHLVIKTLNRSQEQSGSDRTNQPVPPPQNNSAPPTNDASSNMFSNMGSFSVFGAQGQGQGQNDLQQQMHAQMMNNPDMMQQMMDNPMVQQMMSNPDILRSMFTQNPQMRELMDRNPEITHMLNNPELMRQTMELARNPAMLQELMRNQDRAMSNLESIPGGFNALQRMYRDVQEPMMNAASQNFGSNPFSDVTNNTSSDTTPSNTANTEPLPNPWAQPPPAPAPATPTANPAATASTPAADGTNSSVYSTPGIQSMMNQMTSNPQLMQNMMSSPYMKTMIENMSRDPEFSRQMVSSNPMFNGNPDLQRYVLENMPRLMQSLQNQDLQQAMSNPQMMQAIMQIQQGMTTLQNESPNLIPGLNPGGQQQATNNSNTTMPNDAQSNTQMNAMMQQMMGMMGNQPQAQTTQQPPEQRFASQLEQLSNMGFVNRENNIQALLSTFGDVNAAIDRLLQQPNLS